MRQPAGGHIDLFVGLRKQPEPFIFDFENDSAYNFLAVYIFDNISRFHNPKILSIEHVKVNVMKSFALIKSYLFENRLYILIGVVSLIFVDFLQLFIPRIVKHAVDDLTAFQVDEKKLLVYALYIAGSAALICLFRFVWRHCLIGTSRRIEEKLRNRLFGHIQTLSASYFNKVKTGDLMAHATNDIKHIQMATGMGMVAMTDAVVLGTATIGFMAYINTTLTLFALIPAPLIVISTKLFSKQMHRRYQTVQGLFADLTEIARERYAGIRIIKAFNREADAAARLSAKSKMYIDENLRLVKVTGAFFPLMLFFTNVSLAIVIFLGGRQTILSVITTGDFVAFISYLHLLTWPMMAMGWVTNLIQRGRASLDRIDIILQTLPEVKDEPDARSVTTIKSGITFQGVTFSYHQSDKSPALAGIDFTLECNQTLGVVGPPGGGKSTIVNLIPRLFDVQKGSISIDGIDIRKMKTDELKSLISFMPQEPFLFAGSIRDNITFGNPDIKESQLTRAVEKAALFDTIQMLPDGFDTIVGEKGVILSGGQKQRVALARTLIRPAPILILDDPISQVDTRTGAHIIDTVTSMAGKHTLIIVSHRLSAIKKADRIIVMDKGCITEYGTHETLMAAGSYYARTFRMQELEEEGHEN